MINFEVAVGVLNTIGARILAFSAAVAQAQEVVADWPLLLFQGVRRPGGDPEDEFWFDQLRVWLLVQAFTRAKAHTTCGKLVTIAMRLRIAGSDRTSESMQWIAALRAAPTSVLAMSRHLRARATHLLPGTPSQDRGKRAFLSALKAVAEGETDPFPDTQDAFTVTGRHKAPQSVGLLGLQGIGLELQVTGGERLIARAVLPPPHRCAPIE